MKDEGLPKEVQISSPPPTTARNRTAWWKIVCVILLIAAGAAAITPRLMPVLGAGQVAAAQPDDAGSQTIPSAAPDLGTQVAALGRLEPAGGVLELAIPQSGLDAPVRNLIVESGMDVRQGDLITTLSTQPQMKAALRRAEAEIVAQEIEIQRVLNTLTQTRIDANASLLIATARRAESERVLSRQKRLQKGASVSLAALEEARTEYDVATAELHQAKAQLARLPEDLSQHPDYLAAMQAHVLAKINRDRAQLDLEETSLRSPINGTVIETVVLPGERPGNDGVVRLADLSAMVVRMEIHQNRIHRIKLGDHVTVQGEALETPLQGKVTAIGLEVLDQGIIGTDPVAANNARVFEVTATLNPPSTAIAARFINLHVLAAIEVRP